MSWLPKVAPLGKLELVETYVYYDEPRLFFCRNGAGQHFLAAWVGDDATSSQWLYVPVSAPRMKQIRGGAIELRVAFSEAEDGLVFEVRNPLREGPATASAIDCARIDTTWLPAPGAKLELPEDTLPQPEGAANSRSARSALQAATDIVVGPRELRRTTTPGALVEVAHMRLVPNLGKQRVFDMLTSELREDLSADFVVPRLSLFGFAALRSRITHLMPSRMILPAPETDLHILGDAADRGARNQLESRWLSRELTAWLRGSVKIRNTGGSVPQGAVVARSSDLSPQWAMAGDFSLTTAGLGIAPGNPLSLIQASEGPTDAKLLGDWFDAQWQSLRGTDEGNAMLASLDALSSTVAPSVAYSTVLFHLFAARGDALDEERVIKSATGIRKSA
ncbi:MAG: DUF6575 domain-containing protein, partial [Polyangiaceae bacterium]